jgi:hypothetical protein
MKNLLPYQWHIYKFYKTFDYNIVILSQKNDFHFHKDSCRTTRNNLKMPILQQKRRREEVCSIFINRDVRPTKRVCVLQKDVKIWSPSYINGLSLENHLYSQYAS